MERSLLASCNSFFLPRSNATIRPSLFTVMETCFCHLISDRNAWPRHVSTRAFLASRESLIEKRPRTWSNGNFQINRLRTILCTRSFQKQRSQREKRYNAIDVKHYTLKKKKNQKFSNFSLKKKNLFPSKTISPIVPPRPRDEAIERGKRDKRREKVEPLMHAWKPIRGSIDSFCPVSLWSATAGQKSVAGQPSVTNVLPPEGRRWWGGTGGTGSRPWDAVPLIIGGQSVRGDTPRAFFPPLPLSRARQINTGECRQGRSTRSRSCVSASLPRSLRGSD